MLISSIYDTISSIFNIFWTSLGFTTKYGNNKEGTLVLLGLDNAGKTSLLQKIISQCNNNNNNGDDSNGNGSNSSSGSMKTKQKLRNYPPTDRPYYTGNNNTFTYCGITFKAWDLGGHEAVRHLWNDYICEASGILFLIDATDIDRMEEVSYELDELFHNSGSSNNNNSGEESGGNMNNVNNDSIIDNVDSSNNSILYDIPICIMLNKCDLINEARSSKEILEIIDYNELSKCHSPNKLSVYRISVLNGIGYQDGFKWISQFL